MSRWGRFALVFALAALPTAALGAGRFLARGADSPASAVVGLVAPDAAPTSSDMSIGGPELIRPGAGLRPASVDASFWRLLTRVSPGSFGAGEFDPLALSSGGESAAAPFDAAAAPLRCTSLVSQHIRLQV